MRLEPPTISYADYLRKATAIRRDAERSGVQGVREASAKRDLVATRVSAVNRLDARYAASGIAGRIGVNQPADGADLGWRQLGEAPRAGNTLSYTCKRGVPEPVPVQPVRGNAVDVFA